VYTARILRAVAIAPDTGACKLLNESDASLTASLTVLVRPDESPSIFTRSGGSSLSDILDYSGVIPKIDSQTDLLSVALSASDAGASNLSKWSSIFVFAPWEAKMACIVAAAYQSDLSL
jgi:hypothetical protein